MVTIVILIFGSIGITAEPASKPVADFSDAGAAKNWLSVNDNVMGGLSEGGFRITKEKVLEFSGTISLERQGGFASIRTRPADLGLDGHDTIALRVKGDGRTYYLDLRTTAAFPASSYRAPLKTQKDTWQEVRVPLKDFEYSAFGKRIAGAEGLTANKVQSVGFTLADKQAGPFRLEIAWIRAEKGVGDAPAAVTGPAGSAESKDIVDTAMAAGQFKTLLAAAKAAGLVDALKGKGPLTVFAPNDEAFAKVPKTVLEELLKPENRETLKAVLSYHVVQGRVLLGAQSLMTLEGRPLAIKTAGAFEVSGAKVVATDIVASNGVIHVLDTVLIPPAKKLTPPQAAKRVIELAIERGVPLFNAGQHSACAAIYEVTVESLLKSQNAVLGDKERSALQTALDNMRAEKDPRQQAWILRRALDAANESLAGS
jgi:uncharacterized surface protein with fasciclin (FAS1) repeats